ncbi:MAG: 7-cyano-7-deazaguanine synthase QueC [Deltaproteobacteria bacterium CG11_big_fil_rev_8_21_14_0_20_49_13]|nr:MAG: 7-cyano-7-deazaguanine synthase QueC [Deltaproteobacteria bacterium CG11_big_fil_rev_8_21_14_0_20_49_13]
MKRAITLLSGGLDSMVSTAIARKEHNIILALTFDYGQRAVKREMEAAKKICKPWKIPYKVIKLPWLGEITHTALVDRKKRIPTVCHSRLPSGGQGGNPTHQRDPRFCGDGRNAKAVWVPNRNGLFINIAASFAESLHADLIITGFNKEEAVTFSDNSAKFVSKMNETLRFSTLKRPKVVSFTQKMSKVDMVRCAIDQKLPLNCCWPCYEGGRSLCMKCESCLRFRRAILSNILVS